MEDGGIYFKTVMKKPQIYIGLTAVIATLVLGAFYWFEYRPTQIRADCSSHLTGKPDREAADRPGRLSDGSSSSGEEAYKKCLLEKGLSQ